MVKEKRRFIRFPYEMKSELTVHGATYVIEEMDNLSIGGCLLSVKHDFENGEKCSLKIILGNEGDEPIIHIDGVIVPREQGKIAIRFTGIDPESLHHLQEIARYNSHDPERVDQEIKKHPGIL